MRHLRIHTGGEFDWHICITTEQTEGRKVFLARSQVKRLLSNACIYISVENKCVRTANEPLTYPNSKEFGAEKTCAVQLQQTNVVDAIEILNFLLLRSPFLAEMFFELFSSDFSLPHSRQVKHSVVTLNVVALLAVHFAKLLRTIVHRARFDRLLTTIIVSINDSRHL